METRRSDPDMMAFPKKYFLPVFCGLLYGSIFLIPKIRLLFFLPPFLLFYFLKNHARNKKEAAFGSWLSFFVASILILFHLRLDSEATKYVTGNFINPDALPVLTAIVFALWFILSAWVALPFGLFGWIYFKFQKNNFGDIFLGASGWVLAEFLRAKMFFGFGWVDLGYWLFGSMPAIGLSSRLWGIYGLSFIAAFIAGLFLFFISCATNWDVFGKRRCFLQTLLGASFLILLFAGGIFVMGNEREKWQDAHLSAIAVQGFLPWFSKKEMEEISSGFSLPKNYARLLREIGTKEKSLIVLPEEVLDPVSPDRMFYHWTQEIRGLKEVIRTTKSDLFLIGQELIFGDKRLNSILVFEGASEPKIYIKSRLFPFAEYVPFGKTTFKTLVAYKKEYERGKGTGTLLTKIGKVGIFSCLELLLPDFVRLQVNDGAIILLSGGSEIAWEKPVWEQDLLVARFQAASNKRFLVRAMKEGYSAIINPLGEVLIQSNGKGDAILEAKVDLVSKKTLYSKIGDGVIVLIIFAIFLATVFWGQSHKTDNYPVQSTLKDF